MKNFGSFSTSMVTTVPANLNSSYAQQLKQSFRLFPEEAIYVYSFKENKMVYADGWYDVLGYNDDEINMLQLIQLTTPEYAPFAYELNDKALLFILGKTEQLEQYSFTIELKKFHKNGTEVPLIVSVGVFKSEQGRVTEIIGRNQINRSITLGKVMRYAAYGPEKSEFEDVLDKDLFKHWAISKKEKEIVALAASGKPLKEIAATMQVTKSAIEKRLGTLYKRFEVNCLTSLVTFAHQNHILT